MYFLRSILFLAVTFLAIIFWAMTLEAHLYEATAPALIAIFLTVVDYNLFDAFYPEARKALLQQNKSKENMKLESHPASDQ